MGPLFDALAPLRGIDVISKGTNTLMPGEIAIDGPEAETADGPGMKIETIFDIGMVTSGGTTVTVTDPLEIVWLVVVTVKVFGPKEAFAAIVTVIGSCVLLPPLLMIAVTIGSEKVTCPIVGRFCPEIVTTIVVPCAMRGGSTEVIAGPW
ncbi:MAG: hypothetical protein LLH30_13255 [Candidatus Manganitrophus sp. SA1]|nr:hypothetical protein [Candidatus Manganitrophus morganii]